MKLNVYKFENGRYVKEGGKKVIAKTVTAETYDLMFGTVDDVLALLDFENIKNISIESGNAESDMAFVTAIAEVVTKSRDQINLLLLDIFEELTEEELRHTKVSEIVVVIVEAIKESIKILPKSKNV